MSDTKYLIGTSGWQYRDWKGSFYPNDLKAKEQLSFYATKLNAVEVNSSFYRIPNMATCESWADSVPECFNFVIKANRYFTHNKKLHIDDDFVERLDWFIGNLKPLGSKFKCLLFQLPPNLKADEGKLAEFADLLKTLNTGVDIAIEFREKSWFEPKIMQTLKDNNMAQVINDSPNKWPSSKEVSADFAYIRFHGHELLYRSDYSSSELTHWCDFIRSLACKKVYCFFNNDYSGRAVKDAIELNGLLSSGP